MELYICVWDNREEWRRERGQLVWGYFGWGIYSAFSWLNRTFGGESTIRLWPLGFWMFLLFFLSLNFCVILFPDRRLSFCFCVGLGVGLRGRECVPWKASVWFLQDGFIALYFAIVPLPCSFSYLEYVRSYYLAFMRFFVFDIFFFSFCSSFEVKFVSSFLIFLPFLGKISFFCGYFHLLHCSRFHSFTIWFTRIYRNFLIIWLLSLVPKSQYSYFLAAGAVKLNAKSCFPLNYFIRIYFLKWFFWICTLWWSISLSFTFQGIICSLVQMLISASCCWL